MEDKLKSLKELLDNGIISEEEYNAKKREFIPLSEEAKPKAVDKTPTFKQLKEWKALVEIGILTEEEFNERKNNLLGLKTEEPSVNDESNKLTQIKELKNLVDAGVLTEEEFIEKKNELLGLTEPLNDQTDFNFDNDFQGSNDKGSLSSDGNNFQFQDDDEIENGKQKKGKSKLLIIGAIVLGLSIIGVGGYFGYNYYQNNYLNKELGDTVLFYHYDNFQGNPVAVPIAVYLNGRFEEPPYSMDEGQTFKLGEEREGEVSASKINSYINSVTSSGDKLYVINNGRKYQDVAIKNQTFFGYSDPSYTSGELSLSPSYPVMVSNPEIGTYELNSISAYDMPVLEESLTEDDNKLENELIAKIDFDGDGTPELVYQCITYEGSFFKIYSMANGNWYMIYSGGYQGL